MYGLTINNPIQPDIQYFNLVKINITSYHVTVDVPILWECTVIIIMAHCGAVLLDIND